MLVPVAIHHHIARFLLLLLGGLLTSHWAAGQILGPFQWMTGPWNECEHPHCGYGGKQYREVWCAKTSGEAVHYTNCRYLPKPSEVNENCYKICDTERELSQGEVIFDAGAGNKWRSQSEVLWSVFPWSSCRLAPGKTECGRSNGLRTRTVRCERRDSKAVVDDAECAKIEARPPSSKECELQCPQDCVVTEWGEWSQCDPSCRLPNRTRINDIVVPPQHGGRHCPAFSQMLPCENCTESFTYSLEPWDDCRPFDATVKGVVKTHPLIGFQRREIRCLNSKGMLASDRQCAEKVPDPILYTDRVCVTPQDCKVSEWSPLRPYNSSCREMGDVVVPGYMVRTRTILQLPMGDGKPCPHPLKELVKLEGEDPYSLERCRKARWIHSAWSPCESVPGYSHCGTGIQNRRAICVETDENGVERPVAETHCPQPKPLVSQACKVECNWDCSVSQWTAWSDCLADTCDDMMVRKKRIDVAPGRRWRTRDILTIPGPGGRPCPHLSETQGCTPLPCYQWNVTLGVCEPTQRGGCGIGHQVVDGVCYNRAGGQVQERLCWQEQGRDQTWEDCYVPCSNDCVVADWSPWSACPDPCDRFETRPAIRIRERKVLAYSGRGGQACPSNLRETEPCPPSIECAVYMWRAQDWGPCVLDNPADKCGQGVMRRQVTCHNAQGQIVMETRCESRVKPKTSETCTKQCPVDCLVTEWSEWSDCGVTCLDPPARQILPKQRRQRFIMHYTENGGAACPDSLYEERQCLQLPLCESYHWDTTEWSECILPPRVPRCGEGLKARNVSCRHVNGTEHPVDACLSNVGSIPSMLEKCYVSCARECQLSDWTSWTPCVGGCNGYRFRTRRLVGDSKFVHECKDTTRYPLDERDKCLCSELQPVVIGNWSDCILEREEEIQQRYAQMSFRSINNRAANLSEAGKNRQAYCGTGTRYRAYACRNDKRDMERASLCSHSEYEEEMCIVNCPVDCEMTEWSDWSLCSTTCGSGMQIRFRSIKTQPADGGRPCPSLDEFSKQTQSRVCTVPCTYHVWHADQWDSCNPSSGSSCGRGSQIRDVYCAAVSETTSSLMRVDEVHCRSVRGDKPETTRMCYLPCPGECVLSEWSPWTRCEPPCNGQQTQTRRRDMLRKPVNLYQAQGSTCSPLQESRLCIKGDNCIEYTWDESKWSSCFINSGHDECGVGHRERYAFCRDGEGLEVEKYICEQLFGSFTKPLVRSCEISCDIDCLLSEWSDWSPCSQSCGLGMARRYRTVVQSPIGNGRQCPLDMTQSKPCFLHGCYIWHMSEWSTCITQNGVCGHGYQFRNISCMGDDGLPVDTARCPPDVEMLVMEKTRPCRVACPGECMLSEWSAWGECYISCEDFNPAEGHTRGVKARSRAVLRYPNMNNPSCSENLWEELPCLAQKCHYFQWGYSPWDVLKRDVWCQLSNGLHVIGGCNDEYRPPNYLNCQPTCDVVTAECVDTNHCECKPGFFPLPNTTSTFVCAIQINITSTAPTAVAVAKASPHPPAWVYAVIGVGTLLIIVVTAVLYNMCGMLRSGPRPRRKKDDTESNAPETNSILEKTAEVDGMYKQCNPINETDIDEKTPEESVRVGFLTNTIVREEDRSLCWKGKRNAWCSACPLGPACSNDDFNPGYGPPKHSGMHEPIVLLTPRLARPPPAGSSIEGEGTYRVMEPSNSQDNPLYSNLLSPEGRELENSRNTAAAAMSLSERPPSSRSSSEELSFRNSAKPLAKNPRVLDPRRTPSSSKSSTPTPVRVLVETFPNADILDSPVPNWRTLSSMNDPLLNGLVPFESSSPVIANRSNQKHRQKPQLGRRTPSLEAQPAVAVEVTAGANHCSDSSKELETTV